MNTFKSAWHHLRRSPFQTLTATFIMSLGYFILSSFIITSFGLSQVLNYFETKPEITIFIKDGLDKTTVENIQSELSNFNGIREIKFISKDKALEIYKNQNKNNPLLTEMVTASILPASFEVSVIDPKVLDQIANSFKSKTTIVDEIIYQKDLINTLLSWTSNVRKTGLIIIIISSIASFLTIFTIIGMKITNRKDEVRISRLLGASKFYVKKPFLIEGVFYGFVGSILGCTVSLFLALYFKDKINTFFQPVTFVGSDAIFYLKLLFSCLGSGITFGYIASWLGVKRYIKF